jgi:hypothetical protein
MPTHEEIARARTAHETWKVRLKTGIHVGRMSLTQSEIAAPDVCELGRWLAVLSPSDRESERVRKIESIHRRIHDRASRALELVLGGRKREAERSLLGGGEFEYLSQEMLNLLVSWEEENPGAGQAPQ